MIHACNIHSHRIPPNAISEYLLKICRGEHVPRPPGISLLIVNVLSTMINRMNNNSSPLFNCIPLALFDM